MSKEFDLSVKEYLSNKYVEDSESSEELSDIRFTKGEILRIGDAFSEVLYQLDKLLSVYKVVRSDKVHEVAELHHEVRYLKSLIGKKNVESLREYLKEAEK